ncbi:VanZ family protein [Edaphobacter flagellatus]|uniref:VanZ family protein n=1 Tax=Edaphobacter flagellatus TaxID=1933044 RepID=UPI0021B31D4D|nr:VanZ family protein [Edaphobacter flagellatus]
MWKRLFSAFALIAYGALLIKFVVFKAIPIIHIGHLKFKFSGTHTGPANFVPFKTIRPFLSGRGNHLIAIVNLAGNIVPFVPIGFLVPFIYRKMTWQKSLALAVGVGLVMEGMEVVFRVGIFDVDDILLNAIGVMIGYWIFVLFVQRMRPHLRSS